MTTEQKALWLTKERGEYALGPKAIDKPGPGELLVKIEAAGLNPVRLWTVHTHFIQLMFGQQSDWKLQKTGFHLINVSNEYIVAWQCKSLMVPSQTYPLVLGSDSAGVVEDVGEGVSGWRKGDRVYV
jgi:NADPH:quinone reductase-like Zn-dependent oxidoreductase